MPTEGTPNFNAVAILEIEKINWATGVPALVAHAAFVNTRNGKTYGQTTGRSCWSKPTLDLLEELRTAMERDIASMVLMDVASPQGAAAHEQAPQARATYEGRPLGLAEELEPDAPSV